MRMGVTAVISMAVLRGFFTFSDQKHTAFRAGPFFGAAHLGVH